jgi:hypothetical protein
MARAVVEVQGRVQFSVVQCECGEEIGILEQKGE